MLEDGDPPRTLLARCSSGRKIEGEEELAAASFCCCFSTTSGMDAGDNDADGGNDDFAKAPAALTFAVDGRPLPAGDESIGTIRAGTLCAVDGRRVVGDARIMVVMREGRGRSSDSSGKRLACCCCCCCCCGEVGERLPYSINGPSPTSTSSEKLENDIAARSLGE